MIIRLLLILTLVAGCASAGPEPVTDIELASALRTFDDCPALSERVREHALDHVGPYGLGGEGMPGIAVPDVAEDGAVRLGAEAAPAAPATSAEAGTSAGAAAADAEAGAGVSGTNVQEEGVDEGDLAKTDGDWLYTVTDSALRVVDVRGDQPEVAATLPLDEGLARDMLLTGDRLLVIGDALPPSSTKPTPESQQLTVPWVQRTQIWLIDIGTPADAEVLSTMTLDGATVSTRLTDQIARVVVSTGIVPLDLVTPQGGGLGGEQRALAINRERIRNADVTEWLPRVEVDGGTSEPLVDCGAVSAPSDFARLGMVSVLSLDMQATMLSPERTQAVLGAADTLYATDDRLYVTTSPWPMGFPGVPLPVDPVPLPRPIDPLAAEPTVDAGAADATTSDIAPSAPEVASDEPDEVAPPAPPDIAPSEPGDTVRPVPPDVDVPPSEPVDDLPVPPTAPPELRTQVHRFDLEGPDVTYVASGSVPGHPLNQWALSEHDGDLRIATTEADNTGSHSAVRVLRERDGELREIGHVGDLGRGERIYAVRYVGDIGFVVTFRQVDPLYTIDLSDPTAPRVLGELKIPGYSAYLHPVGDELLLGIGQDADADGRTLGAQASLFDVSDLTSPRRLDTLSLGAGSMTPVEFDHRAFLYWPDEGIAVVPVEQWSTGEVGAAVLEVTGDGEIRRRGFIEHEVRDGSAPPIQRAFVIGDRLLTVSPFGVLSSDLDTLDPLGEVSFSG
jgi:hypothetical protein